jgi:hypothetical protein
VNTANLRRILRARKVDRDQLAQLKSLEKRLRAQGGDHHRLDFALPDPQVCVDDLFGRLYPKRERGGSTPSLQGLKRDVRKALAHDQYTDVDMVNAHPMILSQLFLKLGLACPALQRYVAEREAVLAETGLGRDVAKQVFLTLMYGGERKDPTPFMTEFRDEFLTNTTAVLASEAYERYRTLAEAKKPANVLGCGISFVAQDLERQLVCCAIQTLQSKGYEVGTIIHDGFLLRSLGVMDQDLRDAEEAVRRTHGYEVRFVKKSLGDFDESALWDPTDEDEGDADAASHTDLARAFLEWLEDRGHRLVRAEKKIYWYDPEHGVYLESEKLRRVRRHMNACPALPKANRGETGFQSKLIVQIEGLLEDDPAFHDKIIDTTLRKIPFSNGVYCCETQRLVDYDADMYFLEKGSVGYDPQSEALKAEVYQRAFLDVFGTEEIARYVLRSLARAMAGETEDKVFFIVKGRTNSGKGLLTLLISKAFFSKFGNINATNFCQKRTDGDVAKMDSWKCQTRHKRIGVANEAPKKRGCGPQRRRHQEGLGRGPSHGEDQRRGRDDLLHGDDVLVVRERHAVHRGLRRGDRRAPSGHPHGVQVPPRRQVRGREGQSIRAEGGPHHQVGMDQAPRGHPGVRAVGVRGVRDRRGPRRPRPSSRPAPSTWRTTTWTRRYRPSSTPPIRASTCW